MTSNKQICRHVAVHILVAGQSGSTSRHLYGYGYFLSGYPRFRLPESSLFVARSIRIGSVFPLGANGFNLACRILVTGS